MVKVFGRGGRLACACVLGIASAAMGQQAEQAPTVVVPTPVPTVVLPTPAATAAPTLLPTPVPTPTPGPTPTVRPSPRATPSPRPTPSPSPAARATPTPVAVPSASPQATPTPPAVATPEPAVTATPAVVADTGETTAADWKPWVFGALGLVLLVLLWVRYRRDVPEVTVAPTPTLADAPAPADAPPPVTYQTGGSWLTIALRPVRAGLNMVTAVADCEITVTNEGTAPAEQVRVALTLLAASANQQGDVARVDAAPLGRTATPVFALAPGEARTFRAVTSANLDLMPTMQAGGREMLVPLVMVAVQHREADGGEHRTTQGFVVGVERVDSPKLAPFWLDSLRMVDQVAARPSGDVARRRVQDARTGQSNAG